MISGVIGWNGLIRVEEKHGIERKHEEIKGEAHTGVCVHTTYYAYAQEAQQHVCKRTTICVHAQIPARDLINANRWGDFWASRAQFWDSLKLILAISKEASFHVKGGGEG